MADILQGGENNSVNNVVKGVVKDGVKDNISNEVKGTAKATADSPDMSKSRGASKTLYLPGGIMRAVAQAGLASGLPVMQVFENLDISLDLADHNPPAIRLSLFEQVISELIALSPTGDFALTEGQLFAFEHIDGFGAFLFSASTVEQILSDVSRYKSLLVPVLDVVTEQGARYDQVVYASRDSLPIGHQPFYAELLFSCIARYGRGLLDDPGFIVSASFRHASPRCLSAYERIFGCELHFDQPRDVLTIKPGLLKKPLKGACPAFHQEAEQRMQGLLVQHRQAGSLQDQIQQQVLARLGDGATDLSAIASLLGVNVRTLQRRLRDQQLSFAEIRDDCRCQVACRLLAESASSIEVIADHLEFSDRAAFSRAFKRWQGVSPASYRQQYKS